MKQEHHGVHSLHTGGVVGSIPTSPTMPGLDFIEKSGANDPKKEVRIGSAEPRTTYRPAGHVRRRAVRAGGGNPAGGAAMSDDLVRRARTLADMIAMGEPIEWGSDTAIMLDMAGAIERLTADLAQAQKLSGHETGLFGVIADIRHASGLGARPMLSELAGEIGKIKLERDAALRAMKGESE